MQFESHQVQVIVTISLLVASTIAALVCDYLRFRMLRAAKPASAPEPPKTIISHTLVPALEVTAPPPKPTRASRLTAALKQPRRAVSPEVRAIIERSSQFEESPATPKKPTAFQKKAKAQHAS
jgi:hypothetical protein